MADLIKNEFGRLDGLIHCAVEPGTLTPLSQYTMEMLNKALLVNLSAPYMMTQCCLDLLREAKNASVIFTSTEVARKGKAYWGAYGVSKAGLEIFMQTLAEELESNTSIRVNSLDPGPVHTALRRIAYPAEDSSQLRSPADVTRAFLYLIGPESRGITGRQFTLEDML